MAALSGKVAIVTGPSAPDGIGRAIARRFAQEGASLFLAAEGTADKLAQAARVINGQEAGMQLRYLQTLTEISSERNQMVVFPMPMDLVQMLASAIRGNRRSS